MMGNLSIILHIAGIVQPMPTADTARMADGNGTGQIIRNEMAKTDAEANAQSFTLPAELDSWRTLAGVLDGYEIAKELGFDLKEWAALQEGRYAQTGKWDLNAPGNPIVA